MKKAELALNLETESLGNEAGVRLSHTVRQQLFKLLNIDEVPEPLDLLGRRVASMPAKQRYPEERIGNEKEVAKERPKGYLEVN